MQQIRRIVCPIDFSDFSVTAYDYAQSLAWHYKATLFLQHVIDSLTPYYPSLLRFSRFLQRDLPETSRRCRAPARRVC